MKDDILQILMLSTFTKRKEMLDQLRAKGWCVNDRAMRAAIESMIVDDRYTIQSSSKGYSLIQTESELQAAMSYLNKKIMAEINRKNCLLRNFRESKIGQLNIAYNGK